jgi:hypothetical protein
VVSRVAARPAEAGREAVDLRRTDRPGEQKSSDEPRQTESRKGDLKSGVPFEGRAGLSPAPGIPKPFWTAAPSITPTVDGALVLSLYGNSSKSSMTAPSGMRIAVLRGAYVYGGIVSSHLGRDEGKCD